MHRGEVQILQHRMRARMLGETIRDDRRCPNHDDMWTIMRCPRCRRMLAEHAERIAKLGPVVRGER